MDVDLKLLKTNDADRSSNTWMRMIRLIVGHAINVRRRTYGCTRNPQSVGCIRNRLETSSRQRRQPTFPVPAQRILKNFGRSGTNSRLRHSFFSAEFCGTAIFGICPIFLLIWQFAGASMAQLPHGFGFCRALSLRGIP
jgi:hypothetical protein